MYLCSADNSDLHFMINEDGLGGCSLSKEGFANLWAAARATWGVKGGKYMFEVKVERNIQVVTEESEAHPNALRYLGVAVSFRVHGKVEKLYSENYILADSA